MIDESKDFSGCIFEINDAGHLYVVGDKKRTHGQLGRNGYTVVSLDDLQVLWMANYDVAFYCANFPIYTPNEKSQEL